MQGNYKPADLYLAAGAAISASDYRYDVADISMNPILCCEFSPV